MNNKFKLLVGICSMLLFLVGNISITLAGTYIRVYYPVQVAGALSRVIEELTEEFNRTHPEIEAEAVYAGNYSQCLQKTRSAWKAGNPPEVAILAAVNSLTLTRIGAIEPLDRFIEESGGEKFWSDFFSAFREDVTFEGKIWSVPYQRSTQVFYYNADLFKEAGLDPNRPPATWDELVTYAQKLTIRENGEVSQWGLLFPMGTWILCSFVVQNGGRVYNRSGTKVYFTSKPMVEALEFWVDLVKKYKVAVPHMGYGDSSAAFVAEKSAMMYSSTGGMSFVEKSAEFDWRVSMLPKKKVSATTLGGGNLFIPQGLSAERQRAAWEFIKWITLPENTAKWSIGSGYIPVRESAYNTQIMKEYLEKYPQRGVVREIMKFAGPHELRVYGQAQIGTYLGTIIDDVLDGKYTAEEGLKRAQAKAEKIISAYLK